MATLNYIVGKDKKYKLVLIADNIQNIDKATIKKDDSLGFINQIMYDEQIGTFLYNHEGEISEDDIKCCELKIEYNPTIEELTILSSKIDSLKDKETLEINPIFSSDCSKINQNSLEKIIIEKNSNLEQYLKRLSGLRNYYTYLRIIDTYYHQPESVPIQK